MELVTPVAIVSPETDAGFVPSAGHDGVFTFGTVDGEKVVGGVVVVGHAHRYDNVPHAEVEGFGETFLNPELLQCYLATAFNFLLEFASFFSLFLDGCFGAAVFKLDFGADRPSVAEVVAEHNHGMRDVDTTVSLILGIAVAVGIAKNVVAIKIVVVNGFAIPTNGESRSF